MKDIAWAKQPVVQLFAEPHLASEVTTQLLYGCSAAVLNTRPDWIHVQTGDSYLAWLRASDATLSQPPAGPTWTVKTHAANLYASPSVKQLPLLCLPFEARLRALEKPSTITSPDASWVEVELLDGSRVHTYRGNLTPQLPRLTLPQSLVDAQRFLGVTYTWGGISSFGFDCSGLVQSIFRRAGHTLPRDAAMQATWPRFDTPTDPPREGDVLFFGPRPHEIDHVGIALDHQRFLHATTHGIPGVQISVLADPHWQQRLLLRRRLRP